MNTQPTNAGAVSLDQLIALNDEIAALVRAGVPLEPALAALGSDLPGRMGQFATTVAERTGRGESLLQVFSDPSVRLPPVYRAVVQAGLRSGHLSAALESLAGSLRRLAEMRRGVAMAAIYPLLVLMLAWSFFAFFVSRIIPSLLAGFDRLNVAGRELFVWFGNLAYVAVYWGPALPAAVIMLALAWWYLSGSAAMADPARSGRLIGWLPWMGQTLRWSRAATFVEVLALLVENRVPLGEAILLAAETSGDRRLTPAAGQLAAAISRGERLDGRLPGAAQFPPLLLWLMSAGERQGALLPALRHAAQTYCRRAQQQADLARVFMPVLMTVVIGGSVTLLYALTLFVPYTSLLHALGGP